MAAQIEVRTCLAPQVLQSARLHFARPRLSDVGEVLKRYAADAEVTKYVGFPRHATLDDTREFLEFSEDQWLRDGVGPYLIRDPTTGKLLGSTGLALQDSSSAMTGYILAKDSWGQGYATEALEQMVLLGADLGLRELIALCHPEHSASWRILERCGFSRQASGKLHTFPNLLNSGPLEALMYSRTL